MNEQLIFVERIKNFPYYFVSRCGKVFSSKNGRWGQRKELRELKQHIDARGYYNVRLTNEKYRKKGITKNIHRLVGETFLERPPNTEIDHINRNKLDNRIENLRWVSRRENILNRGMFKKNKSGITGVCFNKEQSKWMATINKGVGNFKCKFFNEKQDAIKWRKKMEQKFYK